MEGWSGKSVGGYAELLNTIPSGQRAALVGKRNHEGMKATGSALKTPPDRNYTLVDFPSVLATVPLDQRAAVIDTAKITAQLLPPELTRFVKPRLKRHGFEESGLVAAVKAGDCDAIRAYRELLKMVPPKERAALVFKEHRDEIFNMGLLSRNMHAGAQYLEITALDNLENNISPKHWE